MKLERREFIKNSTLLTSAFIIGFNLPIKGKAAAIEKSNVLDPNAFITIAQDNTITFFLGQVEMGQGIYTGISQCIADELDAKWDEIIFEPAPVKDVFNIPGMPMMITGGSMSIKTQQQRVREVGATLRLMLKQAAAKKWQVRLFDIETKDSYVINKRTKEKLSYGNLVDDIKKMQLPTDVKIKEPKEYRLMGKSLKRHPIEVEEKITGKGIFGIDVRVEDMKYASLVQPRVFGAKIKSYDDSKAKNMPGVLKIKQLPNEKIAVIASHWWQAKNAMEQITVVWDNGEFANVSSSDLDKEYKDYLTKENNTMRKDGNIDESFKNAHKIVEAEYIFPYLAHAAMEPINCTVHHKKDSAYMSVGGQMQTIYRDVCAEILEVKKENVEYYTNYLGGSFGRRANPTADFIKDAAYVSKNEPYAIMTLWTREDDIKMGYYRPLSYANAKLSLDKDGNITGFKANLINQSLTKGTPFEQFMFKNGIDGTQREGLEDHPYKISSHDLKSFCPDLPVTVLWLRSVGHTVSAPVVENIIDQAANALNMDPLDFRIKNLRNPRYIKLLENVAKQSDWEKREKNSGYGVAIAESFGSIVAYVIKIKVENNDFRIQNVWSAVDCGYAMNPLGIENQIESAVNFTIGYAKYAQITLTNGAVDQNNFYDYEVNRIKDAPDSIKVEIINSGEKIGGIGEVGVPPMFAAVINAIADATGKRYTSFPIKLG
ncbi:molybdopterin cofactor-binding domain-containing protein [Arcobacter sp. F2176]|jgi:isoquinoline 1-oxidoreductase beta subunit|uniref:xanthine dehydrogenase family protein molybdopterin-binding subunit n=1 Tax=Arcobacter sp. F2176 TaxID=2044511 RepID=UPI00100B0B1B|nr:molybdopterin cofactor-binding domain-containing protein [Arcobacter sp. F2176]RXJ81023.1 twin-arginine translocation pathway signal protein [Arcobacter sp. F2176]|tara:strand:- start:316 stop:2454 length:2139 start_codon:yes stop_codon:yes gene_type:complete